jgi:hypothetical protein
VENNFEQQINQQSMQQPIAPIPQRKSRLKILIIIAVILLAIYGGIYYFAINNIYNLSNYSKKSTPTSVSKISTPTPDPTANWKTYTDSKYGYSIKYPTQWDANLPPVGHGILIGQGPNENQITIGIFSTKNATMANSCKQTQQILLDNIPASRCNFAQQISEERGVAYNPPIISKTIYIEALHNNQYYSVSLSSDQTSDKFKYFDQILSTFKFTDQNQADPTANWKTYTDKESEYSIRYPKEWIITSGDQHDAKGSEIFIQSEDFVISSHADSARSLPGAESGDRLELAVGENLNIKSYAELKDKGKVASHPINYYISSKEIILDSLKAAYEIVTLDRGVGYNIYTFNKGKIYSIVFLSKNNREDLLIQILSTFRFTK